jgi:glucosylglycerate synthase
MAFEKLAGDPRKLQPLLPKFPGKVTMATANPISDIPTPSAPPITGLLVCLAPMPEEQLGSVLANLTSSFPAEDLVVATPDTFSTDSWPGIRFIPTPATNASWTLTASDFMHAHQLASENEARAILMLGPGSSSLRSSALRDLGNTVLDGSADLAVPCYDLPARAGLINSAILYPLSRALFASRVRFPLAVDLGLSRRMAERLAMGAQRFAATNQSEALIWPINEAAVAGLLTREVDVGPRATPQPSETDINAILASVTGSLFADIDAKAAFWQRPRFLPPPRGPVPFAPSTDAAADVAPMLDAFRLAYTNLQEIWSLVLPPNSLLGLKRLYVTDGAEFRIQDGLWARIVFDFLIAYRLRTINRGHLLGALIPLYLAWVASHINITVSGTNPERHIEAVAAAFEADKPYLVSRWRWPDRFNP